MIFGLMVLACAFAGQADEASRWSESAYGISLTPPPGSRLVEQPSNGAIAAWVQEQDKVLFSFDLMHTTRPVDLKTLAGTSQMQIGFATQRAEPILKHGQRRIGDRPGFIGYYKVTDEQRGDWLYAHAVMTIDPLTSAVFTLDAPFEASEQAQAWFEGVLDSVHIPMLLDLDKLRRQQVEIADAWLKTLDGSALRDAVPPVRWYRLMDDGQDVGYVRYQWITDDEDLKAQGLQPPGILAVEDRRETLAGRIVDYQIKQFLSPDGRQELWSRKTTIRGEAERMHSARLPGADSETTAAATWAESGIRGDRIVGAEQRRRAGSAVRVGGELVNVITVTIESPPDAQTVRNVRQHERFSDRRHQSRLQSRVARQLDKLDAAPPDLAGSVTERTWQTPPAAYLSQVHLFAMPHLLPDHTPKLSFYAYDTATGGLGLTNFRASPHDDGGHTLYHRPTPRSGETAYTFDADGKLMKWRWPNGVTGIPTTKAELDRIWQTHP